MQVAKNIMIGNAEVIEMIGESIVEEVIQGKEVKEGDVNEFLHVYKFCILIIRRWKITTLVYSKCLIGLWKI